MLVVLAALWAIPGATLDVGASSAPLARPLVAAAPAGAARRAVGSCVARRSWGIRRDDLAYEVARVLNGYRRSHGLRPLQLELGLMRSAIWKAQHMAHFFYFAHSDPAPPVRRGVPQRLAACGFSSGGGENIAYGYETAPEVMRAWLNSPGHRRNIESRTWRYLGVGVAVSRYGGTFWAQDFG